MNELVANCDRFVNDAEESTIDVAKKLDKKYHPRCSAVDLWCNRYKSNMSLSRLSL